jgi:hypothetical protein
VLRCEQGFAERAVFGKIRYMNYAGTSFGPFPIAMIGLRQRPRADLIQA